MARAILLGSAGQTGELDAITAAAADVRKGKVIVDKDGNPLTGTMPEAAARTYTPGTANQVIAAGQYLAGAQTIRGDANLLAANILQGKTIFGVAGNVRRYGYNAQKRAVSGSKSFVLANGNGNVTLYHITFAPGFTPVGYIAIAEGEGRTATYSTNWDETMCLRRILPNSDNIEVDSVQVTKSSTGMSASSLSVPVRAAGYMYNVLVFGYY